MEYKKIVIFDTETTGLDFLNDDITQFGILVLEKKDEKYIVKREENFFIKTDIKIPEEVYQITKIDNELLEKQGIEKQQAYEIIKDIFTSDCLVIAYNIIFDINMLTNFIKRFDKNYEFKNDILDVMCIYKDFYEYPHKLTNAVEKLNVNIKNTHRAIDDVKATLEVLDKLQVKHELILERYINILSVSPKYGLPENCIDTSKYTIVKHPYNKIRYIYDKKYL